MPYFQVQVQINILPDPEIHQVECIFGEMPTDSQIIDDICTREDIKSMFSQHRLAIQINSCNKIIKR